MQQLLLLPLHPLPLLLQQLPPLPQLWQTLLRPLSRQPSSPQVPQPTRRLPQPVPRLCYFISIISSAQFAWSCH
jgi:hypothetical protein